MRPIHFKVLKFSFMAAVLVGLARGITASLLTDAQFAYCVIFLLVCAAVILLAFFEVEKYQASRKSK